MHHIVTFPKYLLTSSSITILNTAELNPTDESELESEERQQKVCVCKGWEGNISDEVN